MINRNMQEWALQEISRSAAGARESVALANSIARTGVPGTHFPEQETALHQARIELAQAYQRAAQAEMAVKEQVHKMIRREIEQAEEIRNNRDVIPGLRLLARQLIAYFSL